MNSKYVSDPSYVPDSVRRNRMGKVYREWFIEACTRDMQLISGAGAVDSGRCVNQRMWAEVALVTRPWLKDFIVTTSLCNISFYRDVKQLMDCMLYDGECGKMAVLVPSEAEENMTLFKWSAMPSMCGGAILWINPIINDAMVSIGNGARPNTFPAAVRECSGYGSPWSARTVTNGHGGTYPYHHVEGFKGEMAVMFDGAILHKQGILEAMRKSMAEIKHHLKTTANYRPATTVFRVVHNDMVLVSTKYNKIHPSGGLDEYTPDRLEQMVGRPGTKKNPLCVLAGNPPANTPAIMKYAMTKVKTLPVYQYAHLRYLPRNGRKRRVIRDCLTAQIRAIVGIMNSNIEAHGMIGNSLLITDNVREVGTVGGYSENIKTADVIAFLKDAEEVRGLSVYAAHHLLSVGRNVQPHKYADVLKFHPFDEASNPNEGCHNIVGGVLVLDWTGGEFRYGCPKAPRSISYAYGK